MTATPTTAVLAAALAVGCLLAGCTADPATDDPTSPEPTTTAPPTSATPTPDPTPTEEPEPPADDDALPPGFPDPAGLIGLEAYSEQDADGGWHEVVGGQPLGLDLMFGACFDGGAGDVCAYSISGSGTPSPGPTPMPSAAHLLLLLRATGMLADGTPTWVVLDAVVTRPPDREPAYIDMCDGVPGVAIYAEADAEPGADVPVTAAWGPNADVSALVEVDPATITCAYAGD